MNEIVVTAATSAVNGIVRDLVAGLVGSAIFGIWGALGAWWLRVRSKNKVDAAQADATNWQKLTDVAGGLVDQLILAVANNPETLASAQALKDLLAERMATGFSGTFASLGASAKTAVAGAERTLMRVLAEKMASGAVATALEAAVASPALAVTEEKAKAAGALLQDLVDDHAKAAAVVPTETGGLLSRVLGRT